MGFCLIKELVLNEWTINFGGFFFLPQLCGCWQHDCAFSERLDSLSVR